MLNLLPVFVRDIENAPAHMFMSARGAGKRGSTPIAAFREGKRAATRLKTDNGVWPGLFAGLSEAVFVRSSGKALAACAPLSEPAGGLLFLVDDLDIL